MVKRDELFERIDPPPGGLAKLRARLDGRSRSRGVWALGLAAAAFAIAVFVWRGRSPDFATALRQHDGIGEVALGLAPPPSRAVAVTHPDTSALAEVRTSDPRVVFVWVASTR